MTPAELRARYPDLSESQRSALGLLTTDLDHRHDLSEKAKDDLVTDRVRGYRQRNAERGPHRPRPAATTGGHTERRAWDPPYEVRPTYPFVSALAAPCERHDAAPGDPCWPPLTSGDGRPLRAICGARAAQLPRARTEGLKPRAKQARR